MPLFIYNAAILRGKWSGVEWAVWNNAVKLSRTLPKDDFICLLPQDLSPVDRSALSAPYITLPRWTSFRFGRIIYELFCIRRTLQKIEKDTGREDVIFISPAYVAPPWLRTPNILYIYDLHVYTHPRFCSFFNKVHYRLRMPGAIKRATEIRVPSKHIYQTLVSFFPEAAGKTKVETPVLNDVFSGFQDLSLEQMKQKVREKYQLPLKFLLFVGDQTARKNLDSAVKGWQMACDKFQSSRVPKFQSCDALPASNLQPSTFNLQPPTANLGFVLVGEQIQGKKWPAGVTCTGYVPTEELPAFYSMAEALLYPSYDEGYGMPIAEASACGCKIITSAKTAPEITDKAYVCGTNAESIAAAIYNALS